MENTEIQDKKQRVGIITRNFFLHIHATRVHIHSMKPTYTFGLGMILGFLFLIMVFTGLILMVYYTPSVESAYSSVKDIVYLVPGGRIIRNMHRWASQGMVIVVFLHMIRVFYTGSYLGNRSLNWVIGVVMLMLVLLSNFSGYLLPWDQLAYWAITVSTSLVSYIPFVGPEISRLLLASQARVSDTANKPKAWWARFCRVFRPGNWGTNRFIPGCRILFSPEM